LNYIGRYWGSLRSSNNNKQGKSGLLLWNPCSLREMSLAAGTTSLATEKPPLFYSLISKDGKNN